MARQQTLWWLVRLVVQQGTISLWRLAAHVETAARTDSVRRRFYRFFQHVTLDGTAVARIVVAMLGLGGRPWVVVMDRTNWKLGRTDINILMVAVIWNGIGIPLIWSLLPSAGNSGTAARVDLLERLHTAFPDMRLAQVLGDREFIGDGWMRWLKDRNIGFVLRLRDTQYVRRDGHPTQPIHGVAASLRPGQTLILRGRCRLGRADDAPTLRLVIHRLGTGHLLALACQGRPHHALASYRQRWTIECLFSVLKTRGFNLEDTHLTDPRKLSTLLGVIALAVASAAKIGQAAARLTAIQIKTHGRPACSLIALGLTRLRKLFVKLKYGEVFDALLHLMSKQKPSKALIKLAL